MDAALTCHSRPWLWAPSSCSHRRGEFEGLSRVLGERLFRSRNLRTSPCAILAHRRALTRRESRSRCTAVWRGPATRSEAVEGPRALGELEGRRTRAPGRAGGGAAWSWCRSCLSGRRACATDTICHTLCSLFSQRKIIIVEN